MSKRRSSYPRRRRRRSGWGVGRVMWLAFVLLLVAAPLYVVYLDRVVKSQFEGKRWALPAQVYARPLELYPGKAMDAERLVRELALLGYRVSARAERPGSFHREGDGVLLATRAFQFWDGAEPALRVRLQFDGNALVDLRRDDTGEAVDLLRLDPMLVGRIYPAHNEDRVLIKLAEAPELLVQALVTVEDRAFYQHHGVSPRAIGRAMLANVQAGGAVQGGSTLTQQLVKNFFLSNERSLWRKINEATMALLLEWHYDKAEILEAYLNEIYLGQDGTRAIHGFGLASQYYFDTPLKDLQSHQTALLVALVRGASYYDPRRHAQRTLERRNLVLDLLAEHGHLTREQTQAAKAQPLGVTEQVLSGVTAYPAFMDMVRRQLHSDYREEDLSSQGLRIFTTLDPYAQEQTERALSARLAQLDPAAAVVVPGRLQGAAVVLSVEGGEVLAMVGDREPRYAGFNRALDAVRQAGSLIKPAIYLTALQQPDQYTLATLLDDGPLQLALEDDTLWEPQNYDHSFHGMVPLHTALAQSYNVSTARLGLGLGVPKVIDTLRALGIRRELPAYPSLLLGAVALSPVEVAQMYHTLANGGFLTPLRSISAVLTATGEPLQRYPLSVQQVVDSASVYLLNHTLREAVREGTGKGMYDVLPPTMDVAGKTGTSDDLRDSWFAGFTDDRVAVVWVGADDDRPTGLTGAQGALPAWADIMLRLQATPLTLVPPDDTHSVWIDDATGLRASETCPGARALPFVKGSEPQETAPCAQGIGGAVQKGVEWLKGLLR